MLDALTDDFGPSSRNRLSESADPGSTGALALLETFYHALNNADLGVLTATWADHSMVELKNPVGGTVRGRRAIGDLYGRIFRSSVELEVTFTDATSYATPHTFLVSGREIGTYGADGRRVPLTIRTTRVVGLIGDTWRLVHHHGSIDDAAELAAYQRAVRGG